MDKEMRAMLASGLACGHTLEEIAAFHKWDATTQEAATIEAARMQDEAELRQQNSNLATHMVGFKVDEERYRVIARVALKTKAAAAPSGNGNGKGESITVDGVTYVSAAAAKDALLSGKKGNNMSRKAIVSALKSAKHTVS